ncbi:MAG TPA: thioredoxin family protein [Acidothermaceae bacterium]
MPSTLTAVTVLVVLVAASTAGGLVWRRRNGQVRELSDGEVLASSDIGGVLGSRATLVQFSSAFCAPCRATRVTLDEVSAMVDGVTHVEIDAESNLDLLRRLDIMRTPTVLILDAGGRIVKRASGAPRKVDVLAALGRAVPTPAGQQ